MKLSPTLTIMNSKEVKNLMHHLSEQFGVNEKLNFVFLLNTKGKVYVLNRDIDRIDYETYWIDSAGLYFGTFQKDGFRLSIEGSQIISEFATKNVLEFTNEQKHEWLKGNDVDVEETLSRLVIVKYENDYFGCGKIKEKILLNSVPKSRRLSVINE